MRRATLTTLLIWAVAPPVAQAAPAPVTAADVDEHLRALADIAAQHGGNRAAGHAGANATADFLAQRLEAAGWQVRRQTVRFPVSTERSAPVLGALRPGEDFVAARQSGSGDVTGRVRLIRATACRSSSLRGLRRGEIAAIPQLECAPSTAARLVRARGGVGILYDAGPDRPLTPSLPVRATVPVVSVRTSALRRLVRDGRPVRLKVDQAIEQRSADNVIGELPAGRRIVMAGGHLDSVPEGPGLNDNGSGLAALLEAAERLPVERRVKTIRIGFWTAEEYGLFGSRAYVRSLPRAERRRFDAYLNYDMVGSPNGAAEVYDTDDGLERLLRSTFGARMGETIVAEDSDHAPFAEAGLPVGGVYTGSLEETRGRPRDACYHRACDGVDNVDRALTARAATGAARALARLASARD